MHVHYLIINLRAISSRLLTSQIISFYVIVWVSLFTPGIFTWDGEVSEPNFKIFTKARDMYSASRGLWKEMNSNARKAARVGVPIPGKTRLF